MKSRLSLTKLALILAPAVLALYAGLAQAEKSEPVKPIKEVFSPAEPKNPDAFVKVAVIQWNPSQDAPVGAPKAEIEDYLQSNRDEMAARVREAAQNGAKFIVLSEFAVVGYPDIPELPPEEDEFRDRKDVKPFVDTVPGVSTKYFAKLAKELGVWIQFGMVEVEKSTDKYFNVAVVLDDKGTLIASFRKHSLYQLENHFLSAGTEPVVFQSPMGKVGLVICADIYNYSLLNKYKRLGVDVLSLSTSWAQMNSGMGMFKSAAESQEVYVLAANQTYFPDSGVINPNGRSQSHIRQSGDAIAYGYIPRK